MCEAVRFAAGERDFFEVDVLKQAVFEGDAAELDGCFTLDYYMKNVGHIYSRAGIE